ncbi:MAG: extracellular solute-binding protein [Lachnospiraceae bacterium]|nr:extracellular solute-binding protein [Lachnospiraceae bacterium]
MSRRIKVTVAAFLFCVFMTGIYANVHAADKVVLRICNWEEYIDLGDWDEEETISLPGGDIIGENPLIDDFTEWYRETYGEEVEVEYSTFGTNEDLYNMLTLGDVYDLVCPSEYMFMKLMAEKALVPFSESFFDTENENNYYVRGLSPFIRDVFDSHEINGEKWSKYAAGYMWGVTGIVYNPEAMSPEDASTWNVLNNPAYKRQVTIKDNVRDSYFAAVGAIKSDLLTSEEFRSDPAYHERLEEEMNDVSPETLRKVQEYLQDVKDNAYSFETDSGKTDMVTGKVVANYQWSGDAVYSMDQAEEDDYYLSYAVPEEATNSYFDGWVMLRNGISQDPEKQRAAEAFINFLSRPDNVIRNMYYIGYTSVISGGEDDRIFEYADYCYGAEEEETDTVEYPLGYFFSGDQEDPDYVLTAPSEMLNRQLRAQYPTGDDIERSSIMIYFDEKQNELINQMWINVRCLNIKDVPAVIWVITAAALAVLAVLYIRFRKRQRLYR